MAMMSKTFAFLDDHLEKILCSLLLSVLVACLGYQVFMRYVFKSGVTWAEELSRFAFIWTIYLGVALAAKQEQHVRVTAQYLLIPQRLRPFLWLAADAVWVGFNLLFTIQGIGLVQHAFQFPEATPSLGWSAAYIYTIIPIGFLLMTLRLLQLYYRGFKNGTWREMAKAGGAES
jgi:TRAP-type C4-dicarboxylate transport system permease small subunit